MHRYFSKIMRYRKSKKTKNNPDSTAKNKNATQLSNNLDQNLETLKNALGSSNDIIFRKLKIGCEKHTDAAIIFIDGLADKNTIESIITKPLMYDICSNAKKDSLVTSDIDMILNNLISVCDAKKINILDDLLNNLLSGSSILLVDGSNAAIGINARKWDKRSIEKPETENVVRGPQEGFTETLSVNITLLRRKIKNPDLRFEAFTIGEKTKTDISIAYIKGVADPHVILELKKRLDSIKTDAVLESGYIEAFIEDAPYSIFSTVGNSEKPDTVAAKILEGRIAVFVDGTPFVLTVPMLFLESFQSSEDYYSRPFYASLVRIFRFIGFFITILAPAVYVALTTFHQELIPTLLLFTIAAGHEGVPFPSVIEAAIMIAIFEILREAGVRLPRPIGSAVSIVGALVIGESAVSAGLIGPFMVIIVSLTAISSFVIPAQTDSASILRYVLLTLSGFMGGFGIIMGLLAVLIHLATLRSFGTPYLSPLAPLVLKDLKDSFIRMPLRKMKTRPRLISPNHIRKQKK